MHTQWPSRTCTKEFIYEKQCIRKSYNNRLDGTVKKCEACLVAAKSTSQMKTGDPSDSDHQEYHGLSDVASRRILQLSTLRKLVCKCA